MWLLWHDVGLLFCRGLTKWIGLPFLNVFQFAWAWAWLLSFFNNKWYFFKQSFLDLFIFSRSFHVDFCWSFYIRYFKWQAHFRRAKFIILWRIDVIGLWVSRSVHLTTFITKERVFPFHNYISLMSHVKLFFMWGFFLFLRWLLHYRLLVVKVIVRIWKWVLRRVLTWYFVRIKELNMNLMYGLLLSIDRWWFLGIKVQYTFFFFLKISISFLDSFIYFILNS